MQRVAILGLGLMGGSLAMAIRARCPGVAVAAHARREATRREAARLGIADAVCADPAEAAAGADVVVVCVPVLAIEPLAGAVLSALAPGCVITDVGSTKLALAEAMGRRLAGRSAVFVGSHPIAGSDETGLEAARADLYAGATVVVTPDAGADPAAVRRVEALWEAVGSRVVRMTAAEHDRLLARTSHLPHLVAAALVQAVGRGDAEVAAFCGSGYRDTTRVAAGSEDVWHDIVRTNAAPLRAELDAFARELDRLRAMLAEADYAAVRAYLAGARTRRQSLNGGCP